VELLTTMHCMLDIDWPAEQLHLFVLDDGYMYQSKSARRKQAPRATIQMRPLSFPCKTEVFTSEHAFGRLTCCSTSLTRPRR